MTTHPAPAQVPRGVKIGTQSCTEFFPSGSEDKLQGVLGGREQESVLPAAPGLLPRAAQAPSSPGPSQSSGLSLVLPFPSMPCSGSGSLEIPFLLPHTSGSVPTCSVRDSGPTHCWFLRKPGLGMCVGSFCTHLMLAVSTSLVPAGSRPIGRSHSRKTRS